MGRALHIDILLSWSLIICKRIAIEVRDLPGTKNPELGHLIWFSTIILNLMYDD
jgi:hypothetical protein